MPSKSLGLFPASLSKGPLFCLEFVEITNKIKTEGDLKACERKGVAVGKDKYILFCARFAATVTLRARSRALEENNSLQNITVCGQTNFLHFCSHKVLNRIKSFTVLVQITA